MTFCLRCRRRSGARILQRSLVPSGPAAEPRSSETPRRARGSADGRRPGCRYVTLAPLAPVAIEAEERLDERRRVRIAGRSGALRLLDVCLRGRDERVLCHPVTDTFGPRLERRPRALDVPGDLLRPLDDA